MSTPPYRHWIDLCSQHQVNGWSTAPWIDIAVNDFRVGRAVPDLVRDDLPEAGVLGGAGFTFMLPNPLWLDDRISVHGPDGSVLRGGIGDKQAARIIELTRLLDLPHQTGLEIGPLDRPLIPRGRFKAFTMDHESKADLLTRYSGHGVEHDRIAEPDFVCEGGDFLTATRGRRFDYVVASHVIEHIPDMVGWLWQVWSVLRDGGVVALAIPDRDHTFDAHRRLSDIGDLVDAFWQKLTRPSPRHIIDAQVGSASFKGEDIEQASFQAIHLANHARKEQLYIDLHCNVFTPDSFARALRALQRVSLLGFNILGVTETKGDEFFAHLQRNPSFHLPDDISP